MMEVTLKTNFENRRITEHTNDDWRFQEESVMSDPKSLKGSLLIPGKDRCK